jgi:hypothetical protein
VPADTWFNINGMTARSPDDVYLIGNVHWDFLPKAVYYLFHRQNGYWTTVDSAHSEPGLQEDKWGIAALWTSPSGRVYSCGNGAYRLNGSAWDRLYSYPAYLAGISGSSDANIFVVGHLSTVLHYNGADWYQFTQFKVGNVVYSGVWTDGKEVFIVGYTADGYPEKTVVLHGR